ncbi:hypothetical protein [Streptomyces sp. NPDC048637]|uniref:hypothetical protein n=1 Tax=Streptomyces sp. NPDC048637 TaxID=3155636 RepID=UPI00343A4145
MRAATVERAVVEGRAGAHTIYLLAIAAGTAVSTALVILLKGLRKPSPTHPAPSPADDESQVTVAA